MINSAKFLVPWVAAVLLTSCNFGSKNSNGKKLSTIGDVEVVSFDEMDVVATRNGSDDNSLIVANLSSSGDTKALLLSDLADNLEIVKLDDSEEAVVRSGNLWLSDKRFIIFDGNEVKQFDRSGKYLGKVGAKGNGPGEYFIAPYDIAIDEANGRIYLLAFSATKILSYDLEGKFTGDIPLAHAAMKGFININPDGTLTIGALVFSNNEDGYVVWTQDLHGNMTEGTKADHLAVAPDFSNEIYKGTGDGDFTYSLFRMDDQPDTIYNYSHGALNPVFTAVFGDKVPIHNYMSFPAFYIVNTVGEPVEVLPGSYEYPILTPIMIDKKTLRGGPVEVVLDFIGPITADHNWIFAKNTDYFSLNLDPGDLKESLQKAIDEQPNLSDEDRTRMTELHESISIDDNNYLIVGKWKK